MSITPFPYNLPVKAMPVKKPTQGVDTQQKKRPQSDHSDSGPTIDYLPSRANISLDPYKYLLDPNLF
jgi:hypothetical protein